MTQKEISKFNEKGLSLIELLLAIAVFIVGAASVAHFYVGAQTAMTYGLEKSQAALLAREGVEDQRGVRNELGFDELSPGTLSHEITLDEKTFNREVVITEQTDSRMEVSSTVTWTTLGREEEVSVTEVLTAWNTGEPEEEEEEENEE